MVDSSLLRWVGTIVVVVGYLMSVGKVLTWMTSLMVAGTLRMWLPPWHLYCGCLYVMLGTRATVIPALTLSDPRVDASAQSLRCCMHPRSRSARSQVAVVYCEPDGTRNAEVVVVFADVADDDEAVDAATVAPDTGWWCPICYARRTDDLIYGDVMDEEDLLDWKLSVSSTWTG